MTAFARRLCDAAERSTMFNIKSCKPAWPALIAALLVFSTVFPAFGQSKTLSDKSGGESGQQSVADAAKQSPAKHVSYDTAAGGSADDPYFQGIYKNFYETYRLGPADSIAIRVYQQPDYTFDKVVVSPVGKIYHPLLGDVDVVGLTIDQVQAKLTSGFSQFIIDPRVSVALVDAASAKVGVLGEVQHPGIVVLSRPTTILDAIEEVGGFNEFGNKGKVTLIRQLGGGRMAKRQIDVKQILDAKANPEDNVALSAGDVVIVGQNLRGKLTFIGSLVGFGNFMAYLARL